MWFPGNARANAIADWLAHNVAIDRALVIDSTPDRWPYREFKRPAVVLFLERIKSECPESPTAMIIG